MSKTEIILIGAGGHAKSCIDVIEQQDKFKIAGLIGKKEELGRKVCGYSIFGIDNDLPELIKDYKNAHISIGQIDTGKRNNIYNQILNLGFSLPTIISPNAYVSDHADIGNGNIVMHGVIINAGVKIGNNCMIAGQVGIAGSSTIGSNVMIGGQAGISGHLKIGNNVQIGGGSGVIKNIPDNSKVMGYPATDIKNFIKEMKN